MFLEGANYILLHVPTGFLGGQTESLGGQMPPRLPPGLNPAVYMYTSHKTGGMKQRESTKRWFVYPTNWEALNIQHVKEEMGGLMKISLCQFNY